MFDMIEYYHSATRLNISYNKIGLRGWQACSRMLKKVGCYCRTEKKLLDLVQKLNIIMTLGNHKQMIWYCYWLRLRQYLLHLVFESIEESIAHHLCFSAINGLKYFVQVHSLICKNFCSRSFVWTYHVIVQDSNMTAM